MMKCKNCGQEVTSEMIFCPECGQRLDEKKKCYYCGSPLLENDEFCSMCGMPQEAPKFESTKEDIDEYKGYWKKPKIWIIAVLCILVANGLMDYMGSHPIYHQSNSNIDVKSDVKISGEMNSNMLYANNQSGGYAVKNDQYFYVANDGQLYQISIDLKDIEKINDDCDGYLSLVDHKLYYCDGNNDYYCYDIDSKEKEKLLDNIYYPVVVNNKLYYQHDEDNESIHILDLETKEDKKINDEVSYDITVDEKHERIYYVSNKEENYRMKSVQFDGNDNKEIYEDQSCYFFATDEDYLYLRLNKSIVKVNKETNEHEEIISGEYDCLNIFNKQLVCRDGDGIHCFSLDGQEKDMLYNGVIASFQVIGDNIIAECYDDYFDKTKIIIDKDGNYQNMLSKLEDDHQQFDFDHDDQGFDGEVDF